MRTLQEARNISCGSSKGAGRKFPHRRWGPFKRRHNPRTANSHEMLRAPILAGQGSNRTLSSPVLQTRGDFHWDHVGYLNVRHRPITRPNVRASSSEVWADNLDWPLLVLGCRLEDRVS